jgi:hypothetical protein
LGVVTAKRVRRRILVVRKLKLKIRDLIVSWQNDVWHEASMLQLNLGDVTKNDNKSHKTAGHLSPAIAAGGPVRR